MAEGSVRPVEEADRIVVARLVLELWGAHTSVAHGEVFFPASLPGFLVEKQGQVLGLLTYVVANHQLEIVTIDALRRGRGVGTALVDATVRQARSLGCNRVRLTTTNDNLDAVRFYQRRGFKLVALRPDAVREARKLKPEIPAVGEFGIPITDELDLERWVAPRQ
ncbi:GNAT family N-acetyltransferase [Lentzea albidocapillata]|uniref:Ribosomal protein S18 acetylase RimI n=1 Tax=Lentzea albidocapillata TaxID=40571 RepID=A0A1W2FIL4_9PSEU|nr:GNAT family N-acetyltransferase [Lentzea albidocapillata]SMD21512.1 Ribosomal protein S18 acetylase RimI [Lentzea albidocapillata]